ncbi:MAG: gfo/Idh/MocA family oxidoreductase [Anaerolineaceae bacterium]|nr:gfo/Idh/MocA family oxidoreductase [Anaerolineaceae bacterium]
MPPITAVILGAGGRGSVYGGYGLNFPQNMEIVAVAEPRPDRLARFATQHDIAPSHQFASWEDVMKAGKIADVVINCTMDRMHIDSTLAALETGYDVLLEKPMSPVLHENVRLVQAAEEYGRHLQVCHVLRYSPFFEAVRGVVQSGKLGRIISVDHRENLVYWHMAHSFVRGNWRNLAEAGPMILAKCCHDFDILYWILRTPVAWLSSFGSLTHFRPENAPEGAPLRCTDGCPAANTCKYNAVPLYARDVNGWPWNAVELMPTVEARMEALKTGPYGRCVYHCDNDVVDHQTVNMELVDGTTVTLLMQGQGNEEGRTMRYDGTHATLYGRFVAGRYSLTIRYHQTGEEEIVPIIAKDESGHGGGDFGIVHSFVNALRGTPDDSVTTARESLESHLLAFAAEESRLEHSVINMAEYRTRVEGEARQKYAL